MGLHVSRSRRIVDLDRLRLEDVASGYWTLSIKQSSGLVSHYGSSPSSSARLLDLHRFVIIRTLIGSVPTGNVSCPA